MPTINYTPIFTYIGLNKIANALQANSKIELTHLAIGDAADNINYNVEPDLLALNNEKVRIEISTIAFSDMKESENVLMHIEGILTPLNSPNMIIREYGIYDAMGDLIIISRHPDLHTMEPGTPRSNFVFKTDILLLDNHGVFTEDMYDGDFVSVEEFYAHTNDMNNPHNLHHTQIEGLENLDNTSVLNKPLNGYLDELFTDAKFAIGFKDRVSSKLSKNENVLKLEIITPTSVYRYGTRFIIEEDLELTFTTDTVGYIGYNPAENSLYYIGEYPDFSTDILVAWVTYSTTAQMFWVNDERHSVSRNIENHRLHHNEIGTAWINGGEVTTSDNTKLNITNFKIADEDLEFEVVHRTTPTLPYEQILLNAKLPVLYIENGKYTRRFNDNTENWLSDMGMAVYNNADFGSLDKVDNNKFINYIILLTTCLLEPVKLILGRNMYDSIELAENESIGSFGLPMPELVAAYRITLHVSNVYTNTSKTKIERIQKIREVNDGGVTNITNHSLLVDRFKGIQHTQNAIDGLSEALAEAGKLKNAELTYSMKSTITTDPETRTFTLETFQSDDREFLYTEENVVFVDTFGASYDVTTYGGNFFAAALAQNGKIYCSPYGYNISQVLVINPETKSTSLIGSTTVGNHKYTSIALGINGKLYCAPNDAAEVLVINPLTNTTSLIGSLGADAGKYQGIASAPNGNLYCSPGNAVQILEINPITNSLTYVGPNLGAGGSKYSLCALANNGKIYFAPLNATRVLEFDPVSKAAILIGDTYTGVAKWTGICLAPNGKLYCCPYGPDATQVMEIDPIAKTTTLIGSVYSQPDKWHGMALGPDGLIYCAARSVGQILVIDPESKTTRLLNTAGGLYLGIALGANGKLYLPPSAGKTKELEILPTSTDYQDYLKVKTGSDFIYQLYIAVIKDNGNAEAAEVEKWFSPDNPELIYRANKGEYTTDYPVFFYKMMVKDYSISGGVVTYTTKANVVGTLNVHTNYTRNGISYPAILGTPLNGKPYTA